MSHPSTIAIRLRRALVTAALATLTLVALAPATPAYAASIHSIITSCTVDAGFDADDVAAMKKIADYESHDHPKSHSKKSWGLFMLSTAMVKGHDWADPTWNTKRALKYVKSRYGTPVKAWAHIKKTGWY